jgi:hypothetical protein
MDELYREGDLLNSWVAVASAGLLFLQLWSDLSVWNLLGDYARCIKRPMSPGEQCCQLEYNAGVHRSDERVASIVSAESNSSSYPLLWEPQILHTSTVALSLGNYIWLTVQNDLSGIHITAPRRQITETTRDVILLLLQNLNLIHKSGLVFVPCSALISMFSLRV